MNPEVSPASIVDDRPNIFDYNCFRSFVRDMVDFIRRTNKDFSHRKFSKACGFKSSSVVLSILSEKSGLSRQGARKLAQGFNLNVDERRLFLLLVDLSNARTPTEHARIYQLLLKDVQFSKAHPIAAAEFRYYRKWYYPVLRELLVVRSEDAESLQKKLRWPVELTEIQEALNDLKSLGFISEFQGKFQARQQLVVTSEEAPRQELALFQREMIEKAIESLDSLPSNRRDIRSSTMAIDGELFPELKAFLHQVLIDVVQKFEGRSSKKDLVLQLNTQAFPLTHFKIY